MAKMMLVAVVAGAIILLSNCISAKEYKVGGENGWGVPDSTDFYSSWAEQQTFQVDDVLVFDFPEGAHTVAMVTKEAYEACDTTEAADAAVDKPAEIPLDKTGSFYFICTVGKHCDGGQKLAVDVGSTAKSADTPTASPTTTPTTTDETAPGTGGSTKPLTSSFFSITFIAFILAFLYY